MEKPVHASKAWMRRVTPVVALVATTATLAACGDDGGASNAASGPACPVAPVAIVVTVDQWGGIVSDLAGRCGSVTTIIKGDAGDPHDFEPTPADNAAFSKAKLVVANGADYDHWSEKAIDTLSSQPVVVDAAAVAGIDEGENPHVWYSPIAVVEVADAITAELSLLSPGAAAYFAERRAEWTTSMTPYANAITDLRAAAAGKTYLATESVFDYTAEAVGLVDVTPQGYRNAAANESDPAPGDIAAFETALRGGKVAVLIFNTQTEGAIPAQLRRVAESAKVPVVEVTETVAPGAADFASWQTSQLTALRKALG